MFTFKVVVSTIIVLMMTLLIYAGAKSEKGAGKYFSWVMIVVYILCFMAIWGG